MAIPVVYAVIKFRPYTETEEFANIGVVACAPDAGFFAFKLEKNFTRITSFFKESQNVSYQTVYSSSSIIFRSGVN